MSTPAIAHQQSVVIRDMHRFTGSYWDRLEGRTRVEVNSATFDLDGSADGVDAAQPSRRTSGPYSLKVRRFARH
ncbi:lipoprotein LpqH [Mycobacterium avium]